MAKEAYATVILSEMDATDDFPLAGTDRYVLREGWRDATARKFNISYTSDTVVNAVTLDCTYFTTSEFCLLVYKNVLFD